MLDREIIERADACMKKAAELCTRVLPPGNVTSHESKHVESAWAHALFKEGYKGIKLDLEGDIQFLRDKKSGYIRAGHPGFMGLFGRDSLITAWQLLDYDPMIARNTLSVLAEFQGLEVDEITGNEPGKILHEYYPEDTKPEYWGFKRDVAWLEKGTPVYFSVDSTPLFVIVLEEYYDRTGDKNFYDHLDDAKVLALDWIDKNKDKFLYYTKGKEGKGLVNQCWKDSESYNITGPSIAMVEVQGYAFAATQDKELKRDFDALFWMDDEQYYAFALDGKADQVEEVTSNPGHLLFTEIIDDKKKEKAVVKKLFSDELWTPYGIRTHSTESELFDPFSYHLGGVWPHDNWIIAQGLKQCGYKKEYQLVKDALYRAYNKLGCLPEYYSVVNNKIIRRGCYPQAWASGALLNFVLEDEKC